MGRQLRVAVVGATGMVGAELLRVLEQRRFPVGELLPLASARSEGRAVRFAGAEVTVREATPGAFEGVELALFSAGAAISRELGPEAARRGALVVDNSSAFRMDPDVPLCVPEVNLEAARAPARGIVANPNCSTIQLVVALAPVHRAHRLRRIVVSTYQAISGAGARAVDSLEAQIRALAAGEPPPHGTLGAQLAANLLMHWKVDPETLYQEEELKMVHETRKILGDPEIRLSPTTVRVPVATGHSESVTIECHEPISAARVRTLLEGAPGLELVDDFVRGVYPRPLDVAGRDPVLVGRIRDDVGNPGGVQLWIVGDNLRKGAALNAVQIAEALLGTGA